MRRSCVVVLCLWVFCGLGGCTNDSTTPGVDGPSPDAGAGALTKARTCEEVLDAIQQDAIAKVDLELETFIDNGSYGRGCPFCFLEGDVALGGVPEAAPTADNGNDGAAPPSGVSDTNRQVADVDEADIVKVGAEGTKLYVIRGNGFYEFNSWPADSTTKVADLEIEGSPLEMFVEGDRAVVFSSIWGLEALDDGSLCVGGPEPLAVDLAYPAPCGRSYVKTTVISLEGEEPAVMREVYVDGYYTSSRRHDANVRAIVQTYIEPPRSVPQLWDMLYSDGSFPETREDEIDTARLWAAAAKAAIQDTTIEDWLPVWGEKVDGEIQSQAPQCADFYVPAPGFTDYGMTQILGVDVSGEGDAAITTILGSASQVYSNGDTLILTQPDYAWYDRDINYDRTAVHRFAVSFDSQRTVYEGSGMVPGYVNDQFSIDERAGVIRIATTRTRWEVQNLDEWVPPVTDNLVTTMRLDEGQLDVLGATPALAEGERIFSARFVGDLGYVVTFRQVDPLFAIDLSDPENPVVLGELKIPGFSDYMHPLDEDHLLTIGRDVDEETQVDNGTALQIFDVSDPTNPVQKFKVLVGDGFSEANHNHKAFNFYADRGLLAFPFVSYSGDFSSTLELWDVSTETGLSRRGSVDHATLVVNECDNWTPSDGLVFPADEFYVQCGYLPQVTRGVFIDDYIYSISYGGVLVHDVDDLALPVASAQY